MIELKKNHSLTSLNTFKLTSHCEFFFEINTLADLRQFVCKSEFRHLKKRILGGGSNIILSENIKGIVLKNNLKKLFVDSLNETNDDYFLNIGSGENWNDFISWTLNHKIYGLENLSLIPGTVGAAPIQNIGAYGSEVKNFIDQVKGVHLNSGIEKTLNNHECQFSYRYSVFKDASYDDFFITDVIFKIPKKNHLEFSYGELKDSFQSVTPTPELISEKVKEIRTKKLPNLEKLPNVGSFFKNPLIKTSDWKKLKSLYPQLVSYPAGTEQVKLSAGQLIELCGFKGSSLGSVSIYEKQALIMVNLGQAQLKDVQNLAQKMISAIETKFQIRLEIEPVLW